MGESASNVGEFVSVPVSVSGGTDSDDDASGGDHDSADDSSDDDSSADIDLDGVQDSELRHGRADDDDASGGDHDSADDDSADDASDGDHDSAAEPDEQALSHDVIEAMAVLRHKENTAELERIVGLLGPQNTVPKVFEPDEPAPYKPTAGEIYNKHDMTSNKAAALLLKEQIKRSGKSVRESVFVDPDRMIKKDYILETFKEFVLTDEWVALNMKDEMHRVTEQKEGGGMTKVWRIKPTSKLPDWMDRMSSRSGKTGALQSDTGRQKEALALRGALVCYQCGLEQGDLICKFDATTRFFTIDGLKMTKTIGRFRAGTTPHRVRKYKGKAADGPVMTTLELAAGHACIRCVVCAAVKSCKSDEPGY